MVKYIEYVFLKGAKEMEKKTFEAIEIEIKTLFDVVTTSPAGGPGDHEGEEDEF